MQKFIRLQGSGNMEKRDGFTLGTRSNYCQNLLGNPTVSIPLPTLLSQQTHSHLNLGMAS